TGLPGLIPGGDREELVGRARRAEERGFSSLATIDRLVYPNYEPLVALGAAAAVTERIRLMTDVLLIPWRNNPALVAKQAATVDSISGGRLTLGVGLGARADDYQAGGVPLEPRTVALCYFSLGDRAREAADEYIHDYYGWLGDMADQIAQSVVVDAGMAGQYRDGFAAAGADELVYFPCTDEVEQVDLLAEAL